VKFHSLLAVDGTKFYTFITQDHSYFYVTVLNILLSVPLVVVIVTIVSYMTWFLKILSKSNNENDDTGVCY